MKFENVTLDKKLPIVKGTSKAGNTWQKQEIIIRLSEGEYAEGLLAATMNSDVITKLEGVREGDKITCDIDFRYPREYNGRYYNDIALWRINEITAAPAPAPDKSQEYLKAASAPAQQQIGHVDDLPF